MRSRTDPPRRKVGEIVRERVLAGAEELFAEKGFYGTSVRDITAHVGMRLATVNYHFGTKEELFRDVLLRRAEALNGERLALFAQVRRGSSATASTRSVVRAFVQPMLQRMQTDESFRNYAALIAQVASSRVWALTLVAEQFNAVAMAFVEALAEIHPRTEPLALHHAYQFMLASTLYAFSDNLRLDSLTRGRLHSADFATLASSLEQFVTAGISALCRPNPRPPRRLKPRSVAPSSRRARAFATGRPR